NDLEAEQVRLQKGAATSNATPEDQQRLQQLTQQIESARADAQSTQAEVNRLRKDKELNTSDRGRLLQQIDGLQQRLSQTTTERDQLQTQLNASKLAAQPSAGQQLRRAAGGGGAGGSVAAASAQDLTKVFADGVRAYDLRDWKGSAQSMQD